MYRVENRILPVVFFFDNYDMLQDIEMKFCIGTVQIFILKSFEAKISDSQF